MARRSREKGKRGEREAAEVVRRSWGILARRGRQYAGSPDAPDVVAALEGVFLEVKRREVGHPGRWLAEAQQDAGDQVPVVLHRRNGQPWLLTLHAERVVEFCEKLTRARGF